jgi:hypothetical protein
MQTTGLSDIIEKAKSKFSKLLVLKLFKLIYSKFGDKKNINTIDLTFGVLK